jgi:apolipoprotein N-acyltransferase
MQAGAKIVFWGEGNAPVLKSDEPALLARGRQLAAKYQAYLGMALGTWNQGQQPPLENKIVLIQPDGQIAWEYFKAHPVPGGEAAISITRDGKLRRLDTPYGRLSAVICFDADFPRLLQQAGALDADVVLDPSNDWRAIDPWHTQMASFRAIEEGVSLVRHTSHGLSAAYDYQGRRLAAMDHYQSADYTMVSEVPTRGVRTIYSRLGDWFGWLCIAVLLLLLVRSRRRNAV